MKRKRITLQLLAAFLLITYSASSQNFSYGWGTATEQYYESFVHEDSYCESKSMDMDNAGNIIHVGIFKGKVDFNPESGPTNESFLVSDGDYYQGYEKNGYVTKVNSSGQLMFQFKVYSTAFELFYGVEKVVAAGSDFFIFGQYYENLSFGAPNSGVSVNNPGDNVFVAKVNQNGIVQWVKSFTGGNIHFVDAISDNNGDVFFALRSYLPVTDLSTGNVISPSYNLDHTCYIKISNAGSMMWAKANQASNDNSSIGGYTATDNSGNFYYASTFDNTYYPSIDFDPGNGVDNLTTNGSDDIFITKFQNNGDYVWTKRIGSSVSEGINSLTVDHNNNIIAGIASYNNFNNWDVDPGPGTHSIAQGGNHVWKIDNNGNFLWVSDAFLLNEYISSIDVDLSNNIYTLQNRSVSSSKYAYYSKLDAAGNLLINSFAQHQLTSSDLLVDDQENVFATGLAHGYFDADPTPSGQHIITVNNGAYVLKWGQEYIDVNFSSSNFTKSESDGGTIVELEFSSPLTKDESFEVTIQNNSTTYGSDYTVTPAPSGSVSTIQSTTGATSAAMNVIIQDDQFVENTESFTLTITSTSNGLAIGNNNSVTFTITDNDVNVNPSSIEETELNQISVVPNPTSGFTNVVHPSKASSLVKVYDNLGKIIYEDQVAKGVQKFEIDLTHQVPGFYFIQVLSEDNIYTSKIIKE